MYKRVTFDIKPMSEDICDALEGLLADIGYNSFEKTKTGINAYIIADAYNKQMLVDNELFNLLTSNFKISWNTEDIKDQNWNKKWEDTFKSINIDNKIIIRTPFHKNAIVPEYDIIIEPKMSFGTGSHPTTELMLKSILSYKDKIKSSRVLDMGCGTGVLSIMASKCGAQIVEGIDIDQWAYNNAMTNIKYNNISNISIKIGDSKLLKKEENFDFILANINRNILLEDMHRYVQVLKSEGILMLSGFYLEDLNLLKEKATTLNLKFIDYSEKDNWVAARFINKP